MDTFKKENLRRSFFREFKDRVVFSAGDEREVFIENMVKTISIFLTLDLTTSEKYCDAIADTLSDSVEYMDQWDPVSAASAFRALMKYVLNVLDQPYKRTFWTIKVYSGYFYLKVKKHLKDPERILSTLGYQLLESGTLQLSPGDLIAVDKQVILACECLIASVECSIMSKIWNAVKSLGYEMKHVLLSREKSPGNPEDSAKWIRINIPRTSHPAIGPEAQITPTIEGPHGGLGLFYESQIKQGSPLREPDFSVCRPKEYIKAQETRKVHKDYSDGSPLPFQASKIRAESSSIDQTNVRDSPVGSPVEMPERLGMSSSEDILEGTADEHMKNASLLLSLPARTVPAPSPSSSSDRFDQRVWDSKTMEKDTILHTSERTSERYQNPSALRYPHGNVTGPSTYTEKYGSKPWHVTSQNEPIGRVFDAEISETSEETPNISESEKIFTSQASMPPTRITSPPIYNPDRVARVLRRSQEILGVKTPVTSCTTGHADISGTLEAGHAKYTTATSARALKSEGRTETVDPSKSLEPGSVYSTRRLGAGRPTSYSAPAGHAGYMHGSNLLEKGVGRKTGRMKTEPISSHYSSRDTHRSIKTEILSPQPSSLPPLRQRGRNLRDEVSWICSYCTTENVPNVQICSVCSKTRTLRLSKETDKSDFKEGGITCPDCTYRNNKGAKKCDVCKKDLPTSKNESAV